MKSFHLYFLLLDLTLASASYAQTKKTTQYRIYVDVAHQQKFWNDPARMAAGNPDLERINYMTTEIKKTAASVNASITYLKSEIKSEDLVTCNLLFIHIPSATYSAAEVDAITKYVNHGGSLFLVMDSDYWSTLKQTNVNDLIRPYGIQFGGSNPDTFSGGSTRAGVITPKALKISYHGARIVTGGTSFCFNDRSEKFPFGTFLKTKTGGKIIVMGDGMVSLYMTSWEGVNNYQCSEFMHDTFQWLLN